MEEDKPITTARYRSPVFNKDEVKILVNLVEKYKHIILNKSTNSNVCHLKEAVWITIAKAFNSQMLDHERSADCLRTKWLNLKRDSRKITKNIMENNEFDEVTQQVVSMLCESDNYTNPMTELTEDISCDIESPVQPLYKKRSDISLVQEENSVTCDYEDAEIETDTSKSNRSLNFTPQECKLLLNCVKEERKYILSKNLTGEGTRQKNRAWERVTKSFNQRSPMKRTTKVLRTKFSNMRRSVRCVGLNNYIKSFNSNHEKLVNDPTEPKSEKEFQYKIESESGHDDSEVDYQEIDCPGTKDNVDLTSDPLSTVLNSDSGIGSISWNYSEKKEIVKLKLELLNHQLDTAKLEKQRIEKIIAEEIETERLRRIETAIRMRTARLEMCAAEMKLPAGHPALNYTPEEKMAQEYLDHRET